MLISHADITIFGYPISPTFESEAAPEEVFPVFVLDSYTQVHIRMIVLHQQLQTLRRIPHLQGDGRVFIRLDSRSVAGSIPGQTALFSLGGCVV